MTPTATPLATATPGVPPNEVWRFYYYAGGRRVAFRVEGHPDPAQDDVFFLLADHLGSTTKVVRGDGAIVAAVLYRSYGEARFESGDPPTDYGYTGQRKEAGVGLYYYNARWYDPSLGRFTEADAILPGVGSSSAWDRFAYALHNPVRYSDPSGHWADEGCGTGRICILPPSASNPGAGNGNGPLFFQVGPFTTIVIMPPGSEHPLARSESSTRLGMGLLMAGVVTDAVELGLIFIGSPGSEEEAALFDYAVTASGCFLAGQCPLFDSPAEGLPPMVGVNLDPLVQQADLGLALASKVGLTAVGGAVGGPLGALAMNYGGKAVDVITTSASGVYDAGRFFGTIPNYATIGYTLPTSQTTLQYIVIWTQN